MTGGMVKRRFGGAFAAFGAGVMLCGMAAGDMNIAAFLARADSISRLGPLALATPEGHRLKGEVVGAAQRYKARIDAQRRAGVATTSCPPESGSMEPDEWLSHLRSYPAPARRSVSVYSAFDALMKKRYPCPA
jgi:hypothetical protein